MPKIRLKGIINGELVTIVVLFLVGFEGRSRLGNANDSFWYSKVRGIAFFNGRRGGEISSSHIQVLGAIIVLGSLLV